jgi:predicted alpha/beta-hydrolase family hydrolase
MPAAEALSLAVNEGQVSALWLAAPAATGCFVFAHGAGAGMTHPFIAAFAAGLAQRRICTLRYQFPIWRRRAGDPTRRQSVTPPYEPPSMWPRGVLAVSNSSPEASPSADA